MEQVSKSIYVETKAKCITIPFGKSYFIDRGANPGCVVTEIGLVQIDTTKNPMFALNWIESIKSVSNQDFVYVINTDHHLDHIMCNYCFKQPIISHKLTRMEVEKFISFNPQKLIPFLYSKELYEMLRNRNEALIKNLMKSFEGLEESFRSPYETLRIMPADITFDNKMTMYMGNLRLELIHVGGHAPGSILVYIPEEKVIFAGDSVFNNLLPNMTQADTAKWLEVLSMIEKMDVETIVPGHGHPCDKKVLVKMTEYIREMRSQVREAQKQGKGRDEVIASVDLTSFFPVDNELGWTKERIIDWSRDNTGRVFDELKG